MSYGNVGGDNDSAVDAEKGCGNLTIQRNLFEHPRGAASDWEAGHPVGPQWVSLVNSTGGNVIRFNEIVSSEDHGFNDGFGGGRRFVFHNTALQPRGLFTALTSHVNPNYVTRNNIFAAAVRWRRSRRRSRRATMTTIFSAAASAARRRRNTG